MDLVKSNVRELTPEELGRSIDRAALAAVKPQLDQFVDRMVQGVINDVMRALDDPEGLLTPDYAIQAWLEIRAFHRLRRSLNGALAGKG